MSYVYGCATVPALYQIATDWLPRGGGGGGTLVFSAYVGSDPASTVHPKKLSEISNTPLKFRNLTPKRMDRAYVCMKISEYPSGLGWVLQADWQLIPSEIIRRLIASMLKRFG